MIPAVIEDAICDSHACKKYVGNSSGSLQHRLTQHCSCYCFVGIVLDDCGNLTPNMINGVANDLLHIGLASGICLVNLNCDVHQTFGIEACPGLRQLVQAW